LKRFDAFRHSIITGLSRCVVINSRVVHSGIGSQVRGALLVASIASVKTAPNLSPPRPNSGGRGE
jgi:hypothetical protein